MKVFYLLGLVLASSAFAQTITFNGCHNLFDDQNFTFTKTGVDAYNKNIYITTPVNGQPCGGLGSCEFKIQWNNSVSRWEFLADTGNGDFVNPYLIYYNSTGNNAYLNNPPSNSFGTWIENTAVTTGACGGNLSIANSTMTGDVHSSFLNTSEVRKSKIQIFPNPVADMMLVSGIDNAKTIQVYNMAGQLTKETPFSTKVNVSDLSAGIYLLRIITRESQIHEFKFIKK